MLKTILTVLIATLGGLSTMATAQPRSIDLNGVAAGGGSAPWQPRLKLWEQTTDAADRKRPVLYVHGATFSSENSVFFKFGGQSWADVLNASGFSVWSLDFAGFGRSEAYPQMADEKPVPGEPVGRAAESAGQIERAVRAIMAETGAAKVSIIAHSWGTIAAGQFAGDHPELVDRFVLFGPVVRREILKGVPPLGPWRPLSVEEQRKRFVEDVPAGEPAVLVEADFPAWADLYLKSDPTSASRTPPSVKTPNGPLADIMSAWSGAMPYDPARIIAPVAVIRGEWDSLCDDADAAWLAKALTGAASATDIKLPKGTHLMHLETGRTAFYAAVAAFLKAM
jgi:pimeloyl-ACP methyl ester carboxylesterase